MVERRGRLMGLVMERASRAGELREAGVGVALSSSAPLPCAEEGKETEGPRREELAAPGEPHEAELQLRM